MLSLASKLLNAVYLMRLDKPIGFLLLLWPALMGLWVASRGVPPVNLLVIYLAGALIMRSAGCVLNDLVDRKFDGQVARTKNRPLASGQVSVLFALILLVVLLSLAFGLFLQLNPYAQIHALIALAFAGIYPFTKRFLQAPQLVLGISFAWSIPMAFAQVRNSVNYLECWLLFASIVCWVVAYDTQYALNDRKDDLKIGIKSSAILFGKYVRKIIVVLQCLALSLLLVLGVVKNYSPVFFCACFASLGLFLYQDILVKKQHYMAAFNKNNLVGMLWLCLLIVANIKLSFRF